MASTMILGRSQSTQELKKIGLWLISITNFRVTYGQNTPKLAIAVSFFAISDPKLEPGSLKMTHVTSNMILGTSQRT